MKTLTDDDGNKYIIRDFDGGSGRIYGLVPEQPLPQPKEEKDDYILSFRTADNGDYKYEVHLGLTEPAAQAVATAIEALLEYVTAEVPEMRDVGMVVLADRARNAVKGGK